MGGKGSGLLRPLQEPTAEVPGGPLDKAQAPLDASQRQLEVVHLSILIGGCEVVCAEGAEQQGQEEVQDLWRQWVRLTTVGAMLRALTPGHHGKNETLGTLRTADGKALWWNAGPWALILTPILSNTEFGCMRKGRFSPLLPRTQIQSELMTFGPRSLES